MGTHLSFFFLFTTAVPHTPRDLAAVLRYAHAIAYQNDAPTPAAAWQQAKDSANATTNAAVLKLVEPGNDNSDADRKGTKLSKNDIDVVCMIIAAQCSNAGLSQDQIKHVTDEIRSAAQHANSAGDLLTRGNAVAAEAISTAQGDTVQHSMYNKDFDGQMQKVDRLFGEMDKNSKVYEQYLTKEQREAEAKAKKQLEEAEQRLAYMREHPDKFSEEQIQAAQTSIAQAARHRAETVQTGVQQVLNNPNAPPDARAAAENNGRLAAQVARDAPQDRNLYNNLTTDNSLRAPNKKTDAGGHNSATLTISQASTVPKTDAGALPSQNLPQVANNDKTPPSAGVTF